MKDSMVIAIAGPTASGKASLAIEIAKHVQGEVISVDSRQVYKDLNIGTEKVTPEEMRDIPHHMIDIVDPEETYTVERFQKEARACINEIKSRNNIPILAGGSGQYMDAVLYETNFPQVPPNKELRKDLEDVPTAALFKVLEDQDPERAKTIDPYNKQRLIRALEIVDALGSVPAQTEQEPLFTMKYFGIEVSKEELQTRITKRLEETLHKGLIDEVREIRARLGDTRINELGLEYRIVRDYLDGKIKEADLQAELLTELMRYAKRQLTWFKRNKDIIWLPRDEVLVEATRSSASTRV